MCNTYTNEHFWVIGSNTSKVSEPYVGQPCQCGSVFWKSTQQPLALDVCRYRWGEGMETGEHSYVNGVCGKCGKRQ